MKVVLVHDYLNQLGGAERVLQAIHEIWPKAPIYTAVADSKALKADNRFLGWDIRAPGISNTPFLSRFYKFFSFLYPMVFENFDLSEFDVIISSSSNFAKGVITRADQLHICYCHTPPRFLYHYPTESNFRNHSFWGRVLPPLDNYLRVWDYLAAQRVDYFVTNSQTTAARIKKFYGREAVVIYPPVGMNSFNRDSLNTVEFTSPFAGPYFLTVSRLARYKNIETAIRACNQLEYNLVVVGDGPERKRLQKLAGPTVKVIGKIDDQMLADYYTACQGVICATSDEDFGIVPVEAMLFGKPVIALRSGGHRETIIEGKTGVFFEKATTKNLKKALVNFKPKHFLPEDCIAQAQKFSKKKFQEDFMSFVNEAVKSRSKKYRP